MVNLIAWRKNLTIALCAIMLVACATPGSQPDGCVGAIVEAPAGLVEASDAVLLAEATGQPEKGALCKGRVFVAERAVTVYRVWDAAKSFTLYGRWWSLGLPQGPRDQYRDNNAICAEWSALDKMSACTLKVGARVVIGPGQSARCADKLLPASAVNQVYIPNDSRNALLFIENCSAASDWPETVK